MNATKSVAERLIIGAPDNQRYDIPTISADSPAGDNTGLAPIRDRIQVGLQAQGVYVPLGADIAEAVEACLNAGHTPDTIVNVATRPQADSVRSPAAVVRASLSSLAQVAPIRPIPPHDCERGWVGEDAEGRPVPCYVCKPHLEGQRAEPKRTPSGYGPGRHAWQEARDRLAATPRRRTDRLPLVPNRESAAGA